jgi:hypothetical protein
MLGLTEEGEGVLLLHLRSPGFPVGGAPNLRCPVSVHVSADGLEAAKALVPDLRLAVHFGECLPQPMLIADYYLGDIAARQVELLARACSNIRSQANEPAIQAGWIKLSSYDSRPSAAHNPGGCGSLSREDNGRPFRGLARS